MDPQQWREHQLQNLDNPIFALQRQELEKVVELAERQIDLSNKTHADKFYHLFRAQHAIIQEMRLVITAHEVDHRPWIFRDVLDEFIIVEHNNVNSWNLSRLGGIVQRDPEADAQDDIRSFPLKGAAINMSKEAGFAWLPAEYPLLYRRFGNGLNASPEPVPNGFVRPAQDGSRPRAASNSPAFIEASAPSPVPTAPSRPSMNGSPDLTASNAPNGNHKPISANSPAKSRGSIPRQPSVTPLIGAKRKISAVAETSASLAKRIRAIPKAIRPKANEDDPESSDYDSTVYSSETETDPDDDDDDQPSTGSKRVDQAPIASRTESGKRPISLVPTAPSNKASKRPRRSLKPSPRKRNGFDAESDSDEDRSYQGFQRTNRSAQRNARPGSVRRSDRARSPFHSSLDENSLLLNDEDPLLVKDEGTVLQNDAGIPDHNDADALERSQIERLNELIGGDSSLQDDEGYPSWMNDEYGVLTEEEILRFNAQPAQEDSFEGLLDALHAEFDEGH